MTSAEQREAARKFSNTWRGRGYEKGETQSFWISLLKDVFGVNNATDYIVFEKEVVVDGQTKFIDGFISDTRVMIEQKSLGKDLDKAITQSGGEQLTPYQQAKRYANNLPVDEMPKWIITCNFKEFHIHNMNKPGAAPDIILLEDLQSEYHRLGFLVDINKEKTSKEFDISIQAGDIVGLIYDELIKQYKDPTNEQSLKSLNALCVRLVFCLYAEDAGVFGKRGMFHDYLNRFEARDLRRALIDLFKTLDTKIEDRDPYMDDALAEFPYVNGGLFADENIEIPQITDKIRELILAKASENFDWSQISPTIFGAVFESTLNPDTRRSGGMHYTSIENIHKVIDPLFLDDLKEELKEVMARTIAGGSRTKGLKAFQQKLAELKFFDPACGSGNFLTESYISLRRLENEVIDELNKEKIQGQLTLSFIGNEELNVLVSIQQFYGIEINDFAVSVAKTALWIAEAQMLSETKSIAEIGNEFLPLKTYTNILEGNAIEIPWEDVVSPLKLDYIMGNPPFVGARKMKKEQKEDVIKVFGAKWKNVGNLDYVACWYKKALDYIKGTSIHCALVSTNSIVQGESVANLWKPLFEQGLHFDYAYRTFQWDSEAKIKAHVHCVIIGFSAAFNSHKKLIFDEDNVYEAQNINGYLMDYDNIFLENRNTPLCDVPMIAMGNQPIDDGNYLFTEDEMKEFIKKEPAAEKWFKPWYGADEFISRRPRYCLWLGNCSPNELLHMPECLKRIEAVREFRLSSNRASTNKLADSPTHFQTENMPEGTYIVIPEVSSEKRRYIPMGFMDDSILCSNKLRLMPNADLYHFGILQSNVHMSWVRVVCGRLETRYDYSIKIVYNNFPWPTPTEEQKEKIIKTAKGILEARAKYPDCSLADMYGDKMYLFPELKSAIYANNREVMKAYGFSVKDISEADCVVELMKMYQKLSQ